MVTKQVFSLPISTLFCMREAVAAGVSYVDIFLCTAPFFIFKYTFLWIMPNRFMIWHKIKPYDNQYSVYPT